MFIKTWKNNEININKAAMSLIIMFCFVKNVLMCCDWFGDDRSHTHDTSHTKSNQKKKERTKMHMLFDLKMVWWFWLNILCVFHG